MVRPRPALAWIGSIGRNRAATYGVPWACGGAGTLAIRFGHWVTLRWGLALEKGYDRLTIGKEISQDPLPGC